MAEKEFTTIQLKMSTRERLKSHGRKGEAYDRIINRLLDDSDSGRAG